MCGIAGYCSLSNNYFSTDPLLLKKLGLVLYHRGPNDAGTWYSLQHKIALIHRRLSILDLSPAAAQPMSDRDKTVIVSFNGEIYNYRELKKELELLGYTFSSQSDTEVIIYAYKAWGISCLDRFDGMFAIALFDCVANSLFLIRDRIGIKPLYFSLQGDMFSFASEIKALWCMPWVEKSTNTLGIYHYLTYLATPAPMTLYEGVYKLPAGFYAKIDACRTVTFHEWYNPLNSEIKLSQKDLANEQFCIEKISSLLRESVKKRMIADVPVGVFLSGGVDSSLNVALMAEHTAKLKTFNVSFVDDPEHQERDWARKVARQFDTEHHELILSEKEAFDFFEKMIYHQDEPLGDCVCIPLYYVAQLAREMGVIVVQVGEGADELFCGYNTYTHYLKVAKFWQTSQKYIPAFARKSLVYGSSKLYSSTPNKSDLLLSWAQGRSLFWSGALGFSELWKKDMYKNFNDVKFDPIIQKIYPAFPIDFDSYLIADYHRERFYKYNANADFFMMMTYLELKYRLPELLLARVDKMTMATSVEARVSFLDHRLIECVLQIPTHLKYKNGVTKYILKKVCEGILPNDIIYRKKVGFAAPVTRWFKKGNYFRPYFADMLHSRSNNFSELLDYQEIERLFKHNQKSNDDYSYQLWALQNLFGFNNVA